MMTLTQCNAHSFGYNLMPNSTTQPDKYIKTFDVGDEPIVYVLIRTSPYTMEDMVLGVFDSRESALTRLKRIMDRPTNDEQFKIETHNLRNVRIEKELDK